jgi:hypothetical protein
VGVLVILCGCFGKFYGCFGNIAVKIPVKYLMRILECHTSNTDNKNNNIQPDKAVATSLAYDNP